MIMVSGIVNSSHWKFGLEMKGWLFIGGRCGIIDLFCHDRAQLSVHVMRELAKLLVDVFSLPLQEI